MAADTPLAEVVQHVADGAAARGFISEAERQDMLDAATRGERPDVDLSSAPPQVQAAVDRVLDQAETLQQAEARLADERDALDEQGRDQRERVSEIRETANELKGDLNEAEGHVVIAEQAVAQAETTLGDAQNLVLSATSDADWQTARDLTPELEETTRASLNDAVDQIEIVRGSLPDINDRLETALADVTVLSDEMDLKDAQMARNQVETRDAAAGWTVLEAQADHVFDAQSDAAGAPDDAGTYAAVEAQAAEAGHGDAYSNAPANDATGQAAESSPAEATE